MASTRLVLLRKPQQAVNHSGHTLDGILMLLRKFAPDVDCRGATFFRPEAFQPPHLPGSISGLKQLHLFLANALANGAMRVCC